LETRASHLRALGLLTATAVLWSFGGVLIKSVPWNPLAIAGVRSLIALPVLLAAARRNPLPRSGDEAWGAAAYALTVISFVSATKLTTAANAILLQYTAPVWVVLFGRLLLGERVKRFDLAAIAVTFCGMGLFFMDRLSLSGAGGNALAILSGLAFALLAVFLRRQKNASPVSSVLLGNLLTAAIGLPFAGPPWPDAAGWAALLLLGVFQIGLSYVLYTAAIRHVPALEAILILFVEPVLNPVWVFLVLGETPGPWAFAGGAVVIGAVLARSVLALRAQPEE
jgi:drug/metabolite transporter (DMT)-like permease